MPDMLLDDDYETRSSTSSTTASYGQVIPQGTRVLAIQTSFYFDHHENPSPVNPSPHALTPFQQPQHTIDDVRDQVAQSTALRAIRKAEVVDSHKVGVILTLSGSSRTIDDTMRYLRLIASKLRHSLLTSSYLFALGTSGIMGPSPILICGSSQESVHRAGMLVGAKFIGRLEGQGLGQGMRWMALVHDVGSSTYDETALWDVVRKAARDPIDPLIPPPGSLGISQILALARTKLQRITPQAAYDELQDMASPWPVILVDIRPEAQRTREGQIQGATFIERNVLEWRFDPRQRVEDLRLPIANRYDLRVIVMCQEGYTSSLAAASLHDIGLLNATDIIGGFAAWRAAGLPEEMSMAPSSLGPDEHD